MWDGVVTKSVIISLLVCTLCLPLPSLYMILISTKSMSITQCQYLQAKGEEFFSDDMHTFTIKSKKGSGSDTASAGS